MNPRPNRFGHAVRSDRAPRRPELGWLWTVFGVLVSLAAGFSLFAAPPPLMERAVLFDGKTLDGWEKTDFANSGEVKVEGGMILLREGRAMTGITSNRKDLPTVNYELTYEAQRLDGSDFFAAATFPVGQSHITLVNGGWGGTITGLSSIDGADASENDTTTPYKYKNNVWYRFRVWVTAKVIQGWINEEKVIDIDYQGREIGTRIETSANKPLGFATWETSGAVRGIVVRPLTAAEIAASEPKPKPEASP